MALIQLSSLISSIRGTLGGSVFSSDKSGIHIVPYRVRTKRSSTSQRKVRRAYQDCVKEWNRLVVRKGNRHGWDAFADDGETAYNAFIRINWYHFFNGVKPLLTPPE